VRRYLVALGTAAGLLGMSATAVQAAPAGGVRAPAGTVSSRPAGNTPHFKAASDHPVEQIRQLVQCGGTMYAVGSFSQIVQGSTTYNRTDAFSFKVASPYTVTSWDPHIAGTAPSNSSPVNTIAFNGGNCADAYIGGAFTSVNGTAVKNIAKISTRTGNVVRGFAHNANGSVQTLLGAAGHLLAGGYYTSINGSSADRYLTSLNPATGKDDRFVRLNISGHYQFPGVSANPTRVYNQALSRNGRLDLVMGDFTSVGGRGRQQIFMLNLASSHAAVTGWTSPEWDGSDGNLPPGYPYQCAHEEPYYIQAAAWSPDDSTIYIGTTGYHPWTVGTGSTRRSGLCDAAAAFPATQAPVRHKWVNYTGCDSLYSVAADSHAVYVAGHERYSMNPRGCDFRGPGAVNAAGLEGLSPGTGALYVNSAGTAGYYSRARGLGADDMLATSAGLWIASDNFDGSQACGAVTNLAGLCFLPYR
jgi:hypothetical protein